MSTPKVITTNSVLPASSSQKSWSHHLTIDTLYRVLQRTLLSPFIAWIVVLCLRAQVTPPTAPAFVGAVIYAIFLSALFVAQTINHRVAHGLPRTVDSDQEVVLITGGASGLGLLIAQSYAMKGGAVAVLDIREFGGIDEQEGILGEGVCYYRCDVGVRKEVEDVKKRVEKEVCLHLFIDLSLSLRMLDLGGICFDLIPCLFSDSLIGYSWVPRLLLSIALRQESTVLRSWIYPWMRLRRRSAPTLWPHFICIRSFCRGS